MHYAANYFNARNCCSVVDAPSTERASSILARLCATVAALIGPARRRCSDSCSCTTSTLSVTPALESLARQVHAVLSRHLQVAFEARRDQVSVAALRRSRPRVAHGRRLSTLRAEPMRVRPMPLAQGGLRLMHVAGDAAAVPDRDVQRRRARGEVALYLREVGADGAASISVPPRATGIRSSSAATRARSAARTCAWAVPADRCGAARSPDRMAVVERDRRHGGRRARRSASA